MEIRLLIMLTQQMSQMRKASNFEASKIISHRFTYRCLVRNPVEDNQKEGEVLNVIIMYLRKGP